VIKVGRFESFTDERGEIRDLLRDVDLDSVTLISSNRGAVRGNHYHNETEQYTYVISGTLQWITRVAGKDAEEHEARAGDLILSPAGEQHAMKAQEDAVMLVFTRGPRSGLDYESDTFRLEDPLIR
jgi:quercetin dioxygenase-like cupin family protein